MRFKFAEGLQGKGDHPAGFAIAGDDKIFYSARARIDKGTVLVCSDRVPRPVAVRYGWGNNPPCNLYNGAGLPASPFRTDHWADFSVGK